jgi:hypothetical protein
LVPSIFIPLDRGGCTVIINANHYKTCNICIRCLLIYDKHEGARMSFFFIKGTIFFGHVSSFLRE